MSTVQTTQTGSRQLSHAQRQIWTGQQLRPTEPLYNMALAYTINGDFDEQLFSQALTEVVNSTDAMRTVFVDRGQGPERVVLEDIAWDLSTVELGSGDEAAAKARRFIDDAARTPFDITTRCFDTALLRCGPDKHIWFLNQHHLIGDAWSFTLTFRRVAERYAELEAGAQHEIGPAPSYEALVDFETSVTAESQRQASIAHWDELLQDPISRSPLYGSVPSDATTASTRVTREFGPSRMQKLHELTEQPDIRSITRDLSVFNVIASVLAGWIARTAGTDRVGLGYFAHNRPTPQLKQTAGTFVELFPLVCQVEPSDTFTSLTKRMAGETMGSLRHARIGSSQARFTRDINVVYNLITANLGNFAGRPIDVDWVHNGHSDAGHDVRAQFHDFSGTGNLTAVFDFNDELFAEAERLHVLDHFFALLDAFLEDPDSAVASVALAGEVEQAKLAALTAPTDEVTAPTPSSWSPIVRRFEGHARTHPDRVACRSDDDTLTYRELDEAANDLAQRMLDLDGPRGGVVAVSLGRSVDFAVTVLAAHKAGVAYVPIDPKDPVERRKTIAKLSGAFAVVAHEATAEAAAHLEIPLLRADERGSADAPPDVEISGDQLAYILSTSGTTGVPKLIQVTHSNLTNLVTGLDAIAYRSHRRAANGPLEVAVVAPFVFDPSVQQIFACFALGHSLHIVSDHTRLDGGRLFTVLVDRGIDVCDGTPAHLRLLLDGTSSDLSSLDQHFLIGGDVMSKALTRRFLERCSPDAKLTNLYGPAECCVDTTHWPVELETLDDYPTVPIGRTLPGTRAYVVDEADHVQPFGVVGELCIAGAGVGQGYLGDDELTAEKFSTDPRSGERFYRTGDLARMSPDGVFEFVERTDLLVKVQGNRIELSEVESALKSFRSKRRLIPLRTADPVRCSRCLLSELHPGVSLIDGICSTCLSFDETKESVAAYFGEVDDFMAAVSKAARPDAEYDCMLLYSGGKDSSYVLYRLVELGLKVLAFTFDNDHISDAAFANIERQTKRLNVDSVVMGADHMDEIFLQSLNDESTVCGGCFRALTAISSKVAIERNIGSVVTGLSRGQIFDTKLAGLLAQGITETEAIEEKLRFFRTGYHARQDETSAYLDIDLDAQTLDSMNFADWFRYDAASTEEVRALLRSQDSYWSQPQDTGFCSSNCRMNDVGIAVHSADRGFHNYEQPLSWDIRLGVLDREAGLQEVQPPEDDEYVKSVLDDIGFLVREVQDAAVTVVEDERGGRQLHAFYVAKQSLTVEELRASLSRTLPKYMIPARFFRVDEIPLTPNGKVDRDALKADQARPALAVSYTAPTNSIESLLAQVWSDVLGIDEVGIHDNFFAIGGDSIKALEVVIGANEAGLEIAAMDVFSETTIAGLARLATPVDVDAATADVAQRPAPITRREPDEAPLLSLSEQSLLFDQMQRPDERMYNIARVYDVAGPVDAARFEAAAQQVVRLHEPLHWTYEHDRRRLAAEQAVSCRVEPVRDGGPQVSDLIAAAQTEPFDLQAGPLVRCLIQPLTSGHTLISLNLHHISADHISLELLWNSIADAYAGRELSAPTVGYGDFCQWQSELWDESAAFWAEQSFGAQVELAAVSDEHDGYLERTSALSGSRLRESARQSLFVAALTAAAVAARPLFPSDDVELNLVASTRNHELARPLIGYLLNPLPMQFDVAPSHTFATLAKQVSDQTAQALVHRTYPFARIFDDARRAEKQPPSGQVLVSISDEHVLDLDGVPVQHRVSFNGSAVADIAFFLELQGEEVVLGVEYSARAGKAAAAMALDLFDQSVTALFEAPDRAIEDISVDSGEIEAALLQHPAVRAAAVAPTDVRTMSEMMEQAGPDQLAKVFAASAGAGDTQAALRAGLAEFGQPKMRLTAHIEAAPDAELDLDALRAHVSEVLGDRPQPQLYVAHPALPRDRGGAIDRTAVAQLPPPTS